MFTFDNTTEELERLLVGHKIVQAYIHEDNGILLTDNGTMLKIRANEGCGGCSAGWYVVTQIAEVDNIIMSVRDEVEPVSGDPYGEAFTYRIFVMTENTEISLATIEGDDGNGYYGSGYSLEVIVEGQ